MELFEAMALRKSSRAYTAEKVSDADIKKLIFAANSAPVGGAHYENIHLAVVQEPALREEIRATCSPADPASDPFYGAPLIIFVSARASASSPGVEIANAACLVEHMHLAATGLGLGSVYIWGCLPAIRAAAPLKAKLHIPDGFEPVSAIAVGHVAEAPAPRAFDGQYACDIFA
jgi:nitroreductase